MGPRPGRAGLPLLAALPALLLAGCQAAPQVAGAVTAVVTGGASGNPAVGFASGVAVAAATSAGVRYYGRSRARGEQDAIAAVAGRTEPGVVARWQIRHDIPIGNAAGELRVVRRIDTPLAECREILFAVVEKEADASRRWFAATVCRQGEAWKWASAEPAVSRWGNLQ
ncbi:hypothetical protein M0638_11010 [Roseomonas sp. NAR14]|uniref:Lipoprotein n=1 Tax=Roseomonas acroporae TaxID=2937791 RepID=A0A9X1Y9M2_9PROT|nr:hypothetical protein [Roseomonas acroporae]MCK8784910.1 hypothetical protein [Roseomonas acroporae]